MTAFVENMEDEEEEPSALNTSSSGKDHTNSPNQKLCGVGVVFIEKLIEGGGRKFCENVFH